MTIAILLFSAATVGLIRFLLWSGVISQLEGALKIFYVSMSIIFFYTLAFGIFMSVCLRGKISQITDNEKATIALYRKEG